MWDFNLRKKTWPNPKSHMRFSLNKKNTYFTWILHYKKNLTYFYFKQINKKPIQTIWKLKLMHSNEKISFLLSFGLKKLTYINSFMVFIVILNILSSNLDKVTSMYNLLCLNTENTMIKKTYVMKMIF